jgi:VWFA-related protein
MKNPIMRIPLPAIMTFFVSVCMALGLAGFDADPSQTPSSEPIATHVYKVVVDLVLVNVSVTDKSGHSINDLTQNDFQVFEEGVPQQISVFTVEAAPGVAVPVPPMPKEEKGATVTPPSVMPLSRKMILFVDDRHIQFENLTRLKNAGEAFIRSSLGPNDMVALITASGTHPTEFTKDRNSVIAALKAIFPIAQNAYRSNSNCPPLTDYQAYFIGTSLADAVKVGAIDIAVPATIQCANLTREADPVASAQSVIVSASRARTSLILNDSRNTLTAIYELAKRLRTIEGRKTVLFLSDGLLGTREIPFQLQDAIDIAARANTVFFSINTRGLEAAAIGGDVINPVPINEGDDARIHSILDSEERFRSNDPLNSLAAGTGGLFIHGNNDMLAQLKTVADSTQVSYVLGFYSTNTKRDGKYRVISIKVNRPNTAVSAQKGYVASKWEENFRRGKNEDIEGALQASENLKEIPFTMSLNVARSDATSSMVEVQARIDVTKIRFKNPEHKSQNVFTIVTVIYDAKKHYVDGRETQIRFSLTDPNFKNVLQEGLKHQTSFRLEPGNYTVKTIVREAGESQLGSTKRALKIAK